MAVIHTVMFNRIRKLFRYTLEDPTVPITSENIVNYVGGSQGAAGIRVSPQAALSNPNVLAAVRLVCNHVANMPLVLYRKTENGRERAVDHPAYKLVKRRPHFSYHSWQWRHTSQLHSILWGNSYTWIWRNELGDPQELLILDPLTTRYEDGYYRTTIDGQPSPPIPVSDIIHIKSISPDGLTGYMTYVLCRDALSEGLAQIKYSANYFRNNAKPPILIKSPPGATSREKMLDFKASVVRWLQGSANAGEPGVVPSGTEIQELGGNPQQVELVELKKHDLIQVANIIGIPSSKIGSEQNTSYSSLIADNQSLLVDHLNSWLRQWESELDKLLTERELDEDSHYFEFERKSILMMTPIEETNLIVQQRNNGLLSFEESREILNRSTVRDDAQIWWRPSNVIVEGEQPEPPEPLAQPTPGPQPEPQPEPQPDDQPQETQSADDDSTPRLKRMTAGVISRLITRLERAVESGNTDLSGHREIIVDSLSAFDNAQQFTDDLLSRLQAELDNVLPEQRTRVIRRLDVNTLTEELCR